MASYVLVGTAAGLCRLPALLRRQDPRVLALPFLAALAVLAYLPALQLPFIADDYLQISLARKYGPSSGWEALAGDALYRCRATSLVLTYWTERWFGLNPAVFNWCSLLLHILNTWLVFALGRWRRIGWRISAVAAAFFAIYEGHQEAVVWYAALPELLVFTFVLLSVVSWIAWLESNRPWWYLASLASFLLALISKESAVATPALLGVIWWVERRQWRRVWWLAPFAGLALRYIWLSLGTYPGHPLQGLSFSWNAPFLLTLLNSTARMFWFWGLAALAVLVWRRARNRLPLVAWCAVWIAITFLPYSFLTYMTRVPSRHTYLASVGLALVVAAGMLVLHERLRERRWVIPVVAALLVVHNCGYLWTKKQKQYLERAAATETLLQYARRSSGPIHLHCFPYGLDIAQLALEVTAIRPPDQVMLAPSQPDALCLQAHQR